MWKFCRRETVRFQSNLKCREVAQRRSSQAFLASVTSSGDTYVVVYGHVLTPYEMLHHSPCYVKICMSGVETRRGLLASLFSDQLSDRGMYKCHLSI